LFIEVSRSGENEAVKNISEYGLLLKQKDMRVASATNVSTVFCGDNPETIEVFQRNASIPKHDYERNVDRIVD
jgi:hypothetical protein